MSGFKTGVLGCMSDCPICIYGIVCFGCLAAQNWADVREETCTCWHLTCIHSPFWTRQEIRKKRGMPTAYCADCLTYICCMPCAICQDARELKA